MTIDQKLHNLIHGEAVEWMQFKLRLPKWLHAEITRLAEVHGTSINTQLLTLIAIGMREERK